MRNRALLLSSVVIAFVGVFVVGNMQEVEGDYSPRAEQQLDQDAAGQAELWKNLRANIETGEVDEQDYVQLRKAALKRANQRANQKAAPDLVWEEMGPDNIGGRIRAILIEDNNTTIWTGGVSGGLWRSNDAGNSWFQILSFPNCMVTTIEKNGNGRYYVGTGSAYDGGSGTGGSGFRGRGVYTSTDGDNWELIEDTDPGFLGGGNWTATEQIVADPNNAARVWWCGNAGFGYMDEDQVFEGVASGLSNGAMGDIAIAFDGSYMLACTQNGRVYRSTDNSFLNFELISSNADGNLPNTGVGRARVDISPDDVNHAYAIFATTGGSWAGGYYSGSAGQGGTWENYWPSGVDNVDPLPRPQGIYDLALAVAKGDPELSFVGGIEFWKGGPTSQAELAAFPFHFPGSQFNVHADVHEIQFASNGDMYVACDGGLYKSTDGGLTYTAINRNLNITQFYGIAYTPGSGVIGGTQDNGSLFIPNDGSFTTDQEAIEIQGGDGFDCAVSQITAVTTGAAYVMSQNGGLARYTQDGAGGPFFDDEIIALADESGDIGGFYSVCQLHENTEDEFSQQTIRLVNPFTQTVTDSTFILNTASQNLEFEYTLPAGVELRYWDQLVRPAVTVDEPLTVDPNFFFLDPQELTSTDIVCDIDSTEVGTETIIASIEQIDSCTVFLGEIICVPIGFDTTFVEVPVYEFTEVCDTTYFYESDTLFDVREQIEIIDPYTSLFAVGFIGSQGIWITREATNFNTTPDWWRVGNAPSGGGTKSIEFSADGNHMFVTGWNGAVVRYSGWNNIWTEEQMQENLDVEQIFNASNTVTGLSVDPNDPDHVVITIGGYGTTASGKVLETFNATDENPNWDNIWVANNDPIAGMPVYDACIDWQNPEVIVIGTELGCYATDNGGDDWEIMNLGMAPAADALACPVFSVEQQWRTATNWSEPTNSGRMYAGSHGRGIFSTGTLISVEETAETEIEKELFTVYPNPVSTGTLSMELDLVSGNPVVQIFNIQGRLVRTERLGQMGGQQTIQMDVSDLSNGQYIISVVNGSEAKVAKFMVMK
ncbi:MAG: T9SS type A sorting domain-containing protein [Flavobacteriales bacterium]|nr:T9SS type A sorting domain-containing protein [Flavobacteriales bacterium]